MFATSSSFYRVGRVGAKRGNQGEDRDMADKVAVLQDRLDITDVVYRYARALDDCDWALLRTCFLPDATANYPDKIALRGYDAIEDLCRATFEPISASQHINSNVVVSVDGDRARATSYLHAQHVLLGLPDGEQFIFAGRYTDDLVRTADGWRIAELTLEPTWTAGNPEVAAGAAAKTPPPRQL